MSSLRAVSAPRIARLRAPNAPLSLDSKFHFLLPYSPDLNLIEQVFAKLKHLLRKARARTLDSIWRGIGKWLPHFSAAECANHFRNAGYAST